MKMKFFLILLAMLAFTIFTPAAAAGTTTVDSAVSLANVIEWGYTNINVSPGMGLTIYDPENTSFQITIPKGTTVTFLDGGNFVNINCPIHNYGTFINNNQNMMNKEVINNYGSFVNNGRFYNESSGNVNNKPEGIINNTGRMSNSGGTINNEGTFMNSGDFVDNGTYTGNPIVIDNEVMLIHEGASIYYRSFADAVKNLSKDGDEIRILKDITIDGNVTMPYWRFTLSGANESGGVYTLTVNNGDIMPKSDVLLKDIKLAHTGTSGGSLNVYSTQVIEVGYEQYYEDYQPANVTVGTGVMFEDIDFFGKTDLDSTLYIRGDADLGSNQISGVRNVNILGSSLRASRISTANLSLNNGSGLDISEGDGLAVSNSISSNGTSANTLFLHAPADHSGTIYSLKLSKVIGGTSPITLTPSEESVFFYKGKLIYLDSAATGNDEKKFKSGDSKFTVVKRTLDGKQYLTVINTSYLALTNKETPITYGDESFTLSASVTDGNGLPITYGAVKFYKGTSAVESNLLAEVNADSSGKAECIVNVTDDIKVGNNSFYAVYTDSSDNYYTSNAAAIVKIEQKNLNISSAVVSDKTYDGTAAAEVTEISLTGILGDDVVTAGATASFTDPNVGVNKIVDLHNIALSGTDAAKYTIAPEISGIVTAAQITKMTPAVQLSAPPEAETGPGYPAVLTARVFGAAGGSIPSGTVTFYNGETLLGTAVCNAGGEAAFTWSGGPEGTYSFSAVYGGDANYGSAAGVIESYTVSKLNQADLIISGKPENIYYGDSFTLIIGGGSGDGALSFSVTSGTSVNVDAADGTVTAAGIGDSTVTVTKAGTSVYEPIGTNITIHVQEKVLNIVGAVVSDKTYDGTAAAEVTEISLTGILGDDVVTAGATASFTDPNVGVNKIVDLHNIALSGTDAAKYTIAPEISGIATAAQITRMTPAVQLSAPPESETGPGYSAVLTAKVFGAAGGSIPSGTVTFCNGETLLGTAVCNASGEAAFTWGGGPEGTYSFYAIFGGDTNYDNAAGVIESYTVSKLNQADLIISGMPENIYYGDAFALSMSGGSGDGAVSFAVTSGTSVNVDENSGAVTAVGIGDSTVTVTKAGTSVYEPVSTEVVINVQPKKLVICGVLITEKVYDGTAAAEVKGGSLDGGVLSGDDVTLAAEGAVGEFEDKNAGINKAVTVSGYTLEGAEALYYQVIQPVVAGSIQKRDITASSIEINDKVYDRTATASISSIALSWTAAGDDIYIHIPAAAAVFCNPDVGSGKNVNVTGLELAGDDAGNYNLISSTASATGNILPAGTVAAPSASPASDEILSGTGVALVTATEGASIHFTLDGSTPTSSDSTYTDPILIRGNPGTEISIKAIAVKIGMSDSTIMIKNYTIAEPGSIIINAAPDDQKITLSWNAIPDAAFYKIYDSDGNYLGDGAPISGSVYGYTVIGLTNGTSYGFTVNAIDGESRIVNSSQASATPRTIPGVPVNVTAAAGNKRATVRFTAPADNGGSEVLGYIVTSEPGNITASGSGSPITVTGLNNGTEYTFTVKAYNAAGNGGTSSASNAVTPFTPASGGSQPSSSSTVTASTPIIVNGQAINAGTINITTRQNQTITTVVIDEKKIEESLNEAGSNAILTIPIYNASDVHAGQLDGQTIKSMELKEAVLEIKTENVTYTIPASEINIDNISSQIGEQTELKNIRISISIATPTEDTVRTIMDTANRKRYQIVVKPIQYEIVCTSGNKTIYVSKFSGYVERTVAIPKGIDPSKITTGVVLNNDGTFSHVPTSIVIINGKYYAKLCSLTNSTYSVIWSPKAFKGIENHWAKNDINDMGSRLIFEGVWNESIEPDKEITRAEFAAIAVRALGLMRTDAGKDVFKDVKKDAWYYDAVSIAYEYGLIDGYKNGTFGPAQRITREEAMVIIARMMKITGLEIALKDNEIEKQLSGFNDASDLGDYARNGVTDCIKAGIVFGRSANMIAPKDNITRAETIVIVRRLLKESKLIN